MPSSRHLEKGLRFLNSVKSILTKTPLKFVPQKIPQKLIKSTQQVVFTKCFICQMWSNKHLNPFSQLLMRKVCPVINNPTSAT